jgi:hypothetical protein
MRRLAASDLLPERAGQPVKVWVHVPLAELRAMEDGSWLEAEWVTELRIRWAARRAQAADGTGSDGGAWLDGDAARAAACDAAVAPVVTGEVDLGALDDLVRLCLQLTGHGASSEPRQDPAHTDAAAPASPGGLASFLRTRQLGARLAGPSLPLDIGFSTTIPAGIRNAVILRDRRCRWPGGCNQPAAACQVQRGGERGAGQALLARAERGGCHGVVRETVPDQDPGHGRAAGYGDVREGREVAGDIAGERPRQASRSCRVALANRCRVK